MYGSYVKIGWRNMWRSKGYSLINVGGLAVGMAVAMIIGLWIRDEFSYDHYNRNYDKVAQVLQNQSFNGEVETEQSIPVPLYAELKKTYGEDFRYLTITSWLGDHILSYDGQQISKSGNFMDIDAPKIMDLRMVAGSMEGLKDPGSILLASSTAKALFGDRDPIGEQMRLDNHLDVKVTGVYEDIPFESKFRKYQFIAPWELFVSSEPWVRRARDQNHWGNNSFQMFAQIADNSVMKDVSLRIKNSKYDQVDDMEKSFKPEIFLHPMSDWRLQSNFEGGVVKGGFIQYVWMFGAVGVFVLLLACINFMNLSTARSEQRAKEVGIRKSIGSVRNQLVIQFLSESFLVVILAFIFTLILVGILIPEFNTLTDKRISIPFSDSTFWLLSFGFILATGLLAGSYPALYLSSFQPVKVLKGTFKAGRFASLPRKVLVVVQFTVSATLIIGTMVVYHQIQYTKNRPVGYDADKVIMIQKKSPDFKGKHEVLKNELKSAGLIEEMSESSSPLTAVWSNNGGFNWEGKDPQLQEEFATIWVTNGYGKTISWELKDGRDFSDEFLGDSASIIINEAAVRFMNLKEPVGTRVRWGDEKNGRDFIVVGVVKDILMESPFKSVKQTIYLARTNPNRLSWNNLSWIELKLSQNKSTAESLKGIENIFRKNFPGVPFDFKFVDQEHGIKFEAEERVGVLSGVFASLAIFISCLGLFGLASFVAEQRTKEIGIRKVLGASVPDVWQMLSRDFVLLALVSSLIAVPLSWYFLNGWLEGYEYRDEISWWVFVAAIAGAVMITLLTVSFQALKAAYASPVKSLRSE